MDIEKISKILGLFGVVVPIAWGVITYSINLENERKAFSFKNYHELVSEIYDGGRRGYKGSQRALVYELSNFPEYKEFTCRELPRMKEDYSKANTHHTREKRMILNATLFEEIDFLTKKLNCLS